MIETTAGQMDPTGGMVVPERPIPLGSLVAAAARLTSAQMKDRKGHAGLGKSEDWQEDAWDMYDLVGEQRFLATTLANRLGQARFYVGELPDDSTEDVTPLPPEHLAVRVFDSLNARGMTLNQIASRLGLNLFMPGDGWVVGIPSTPERDDRDPSEGLSPVGRSSGVDLGSLQWSMMSTSEVKANASGKLTLTGQYADPSREYEADEVFLIRVWRPHPRFWHKPDSPTRSSLPVLRELNGLTMHISAQVDSRLAGAGLMLVPASADAALRASPGYQEVSGSDSSPFAEALQEAMLTPIADRSNASAVVPLTVVVPDDSVEKFRHMSFSGPLDTEARALRDEAIRRLALGQDCPPELLLGVGGMNHWGAWLVREDVVTTHLEPPLALICDALTTQFLWTVLEQQGVPSDEFHRYVVWYDVDHLVQRPNRVQDAKDLHAVGALSDMALRDSAGFDESDAPVVDASTATDPAIVAALALASQAPSLAQNPGLPALVEQIRSLYRDAPTSEDPVGDAIRDGEEPETAEEGEKVIPDEDESTGPEDALTDPSLAASGHLITSPATVNAGHLERLTAEAEEAAE